MDRWFGRRWKTPPSEGNEAYVAIVSAAMDDDDHPRKVVLRAVYHRGGRVISTKDGNGKVVGYNWGPREGWGPVAPVPYPEEQETE